MVSPIASFPSFTVSTMLLPFLTFMVFVEVVFGRGFEEYIQFFDLFFMGLCCQVVFCIILQLKWIPPLEIPTRIRHLKVVMIVLLLILTIQTGAILYVLFAEPDKDQSYKYMIAAYVVVLAGTTPIIVAFCLTKLSGFLFHTSDILEWMHLIFGFVVLFPYDLARKKDPRALFVIFSPLYVFILKGVYNVLFNAYAFTWFHEQDRFISCKSWTGTEYRGRISGYYPFLYIELQEVEIHEKGQRVDNEDKVTLILFSIRTVHHIQQPGILQ